jgi:hypothetical protein
MAHRIAKRDHSNSVRETAGKFFEKQLSDLSLTIEQIETQSLQELEHSLETVNQAIKNPEQFGVLSIAVGGEGDVYIAKAKQESLFTIGILPFLLERKRLIINRISFLKGEEGIAGLREFIRTGVDKEVQHQLEQRIDNLQSELQTWQKRAAEAEEIQQESEMEQRIKWEHVRAELFERRSKVWQTILERESVATIVGALLLIVIVLLQAVILIFGVEMPEMLNNAFLVILGYFFGQATLRKSSSE